MTVATILLLQAEGAGGAGFAQFIPLIAFIAIIYFLFIMPQRREQKRHREMVAALAKGDEVLTSGGIIGEIVHLADDAVTIRTGESRVVVERSRVASLWGESAKRKAATR